MILIYSPLTKQFVKWCAIFAALRDNKQNKIVSWDLSGQRIDPEIAKVLAEYVSVSTAVTSLKYAAFHPQPWCQHCAPTPPHARPVAVSSR